MVLRIQRERAGGIFRNTQRHNPKLSKSLFPSSAFKKEHSTTRRHADRETEIDLNARKETARSRVGFLLLGLSSSFKNFLTRIEEKKNERKLHFRLFRV